MDASEPATPVTVRTRSSFTFFGGREFERRKEVSVAANILSATRDRKKRQPTTTNNNHRRRRQQNDNSTLVGVDRGNTISWPVRRWPLKRVLSPIPFYDVSLLDRIVPTGGIAVCKGHLWHCCSFIIIIIDDHIYEKAIFDTIGLRCNRETPSEPTRPV